MFSTTIGRIVIGCLVVGFIYCAINRDSTEESANLGKSPTVAKAIEQMVEESKSTDSHPLIAALSDDLTANSLALSDADLSRNSEPAMNDGGGLQEEFQLDLPLPQFQSADNGMENSFPSDARIENDDEFDWSGVQETEFVETRQPEFQPVSQPTIINQPSNSNLVKNRFVTEENAPNDSRPKISDMGRGNVNESRWQNNPYLDQPVSQSQSHAGQMATSSNQQMIENQFATGNDRPESIMETVQSEAAAIPPNQGSVDAVPAQAAISNEQFDISPRATAKQVSYQITESVAVQCVHHIEYGKSLARRGASYAASQEFYTALRKIAQSADTQANSVHHTKCLKDAIVAMREAEDFFVADTESQMIVDVTHILDGHTSRVIDQSLAASTTPISALQQYYAFAEDKIREACGANAVSGEALYCLGRLHSMLAKHDVKQDPLNVAKSIVFHKIALRANPKNYRSANELGVLLSKSGKMNEAIALFRQSLRIIQTPQTWKNLADLHAQLGQSKLANMAKHEYDVLVQTRLQQPMPHQIQWMSPDEFNQTGPSEVYERTASLPTAVGNGPVPGNSSPANESFLNKLKKIF